MLKKIHLDSFALKLVAILTMTIDHIGFALGSYYGFRNGNISMTIDIFRSIGRIAFPLFCFMICEGAIHTKNFKKYILRMGIMAFLILLADLALNFLPIFQGIGMDTMESINIYIDLILGAVAVYCLMNKKIYIKLLALLPLLYSIVCHIFAVYETMHPSTTIWIIPFFLRPEYGFFGILLCISFYLCYLIKGIWFKNESEKAGVPEEAIKNEDTERLVINLFSIMALLVCVSIYYVTLYYIDPIELNVVPPTYSVFAGAFILFYNGKRGYNRKWFQYGCYLYYPVHILIIFGIFELISLI